MNQNQQVVLDVEEAPNIGKWITLSIQHLIRHVWGNGTGSIPSRIKPWGCFDLKRTRNTCLSPDYEREDSSLLRFVIRFYRSNPRC